jgi:TolB protein
MISVLPLDSRDKEGRHMRSGWLIPFVCTLAVLGAVLWGATPAGATFPGPDGRIAFTSDRYGDTLNIFTMNSDGSDVRQLTFLTADQGAALRQEWSPDASTLVFEQRDPEGSVRQVYVMNADGSDQHLLFAETPPTQDFSPTFSPDGRKVIFNRCRFDLEACAIYTVKIDGHGMTAITNLNDNIRHNIFDFDPEYSPDGSTIAFDSFNRGGVVAAVYLMDPRGQNIHRITPTRLNAADPDWAPDGSRIVFDTNCCNPRTSAIWSVSPDGTSLEHLTFPGTRHDFTPEYAPAGDRITFERDSPDFSTGGVWTMNPDGTDLVKIQADAFIPSWGPAG